MIIEIISNLPLLYDFCIKVISLTFFILFFEINLDKCSVEVRIKHEIRKIDIKTLFFYY